MDCGFPPSCEKEFDADDNDLPQSTCEQRRRKKGIEKSFEGEGYFLRYEPGYPVEDEDVQTHQQFRHTTRMMLKRSTLL